MNMQTSHKLTHFLLTLTALLACVATSWAQQVPNAGDPNRANIPSPVKPGSLLFYDIYTSRIGDATENTRMNITNTHPSRPVLVHFFFVRKSDCTLADAYICLTANQTFSFLASEYDPNETGFLFAVATNAAGVPISHNYLIGDLYVKSAFGTTSYFQANLGAMAFSARKLWDADANGGAGALTDWNDGAAGLVWKFDPSRASVAFGDYKSDIQENLYDFVPNRLAVDNLQSIGNNNQTLMIIHSMQGTVVQAGVIGSLAGQVFNDTEKGFSYQLRGFGCLETRLINDSLIRIPGTYSNVIPAGRTGWMYLQSPMNNTAGMPNLGLLGATIVANPNAATDRGAFNGGHHMHFLQVKENPGFAIPVFSVGTCFNL
jgi:hypothetical protein